MRATWYFVAIVILSAALADAQSATTDGVQAIVRGDYATAARVLQPLAENTAHPDPVAQFFMASLYHAGHGVARNPDRACGLYLSAAKQTNPLQWQALMLAEALQEDLPRFPGFCDAASVDAWGNPPVSSFVLGRDHSVHIDQSGFVIRYQSASKTVNTMLGGIGWVYPSIRHTQVDVMSPVSARRHFIEFFIWIPGRAQEREMWTLWWSAYEVIGAETVAVPGEGALATATGAQPPLFPVDEVARIGVNAKGEAEFRVQGANERSGVIPYKEGR